MPCTQTLWKGRALSVEVSNGKEAFTTNCHNSHYFKLLCKMKCFAYGYTHWNKTFSNVGNILSSLCPFLPLWQGCNCFIIMIDFCFCWARIGLKVMAFCFLNTFVSQIVFFQWIKIGIWNTKHLIMLNVNFYWQLCCVTLLIIFYFWSCN